MFPALVGFDSMSYDLVCMCYINFNFSVKCSQTFSRSFLDADSRNGSCGSNRAQCNLKLPRCKLWLDKEKSPSQRSPVGDADFVYTLPEMRHELEHGGGQ